MYFDTQGRKAGNPISNPLKGCRKYILNRIIESFLLFVVTEAPLHLVFHLHLQRHLTIEEEPTTAPLRETIQT